MSFVYVGTELDLFAAAVNWKAYVRRQVRPYLGRDVLEVGAGNGNTTRALCDGAFDRWLCLEPDASLADRLFASIDSGLLPECCRTKLGTLDDLGGQERFDTVLYMDVLEHIADDHAELARAAALLRSGGHLIVLAPAHEWLFSPFDQAIGHHRRYTRTTLRRAAPDGLALIRLVYLDSVGMLASLGNRLLLRRSMPAPRQIRVWDRLMVPLSRLVDPLLGYSFGKSALAVWRKRDPARR
jgi:SAM-dependent methyltransferase